MAATAVLTSDKSQTRRPIVGKGEFTYELIHDWGNLPDSHKWGNTHGIVFDEQGRFYVIHDVNAESASPNGVVVFDPDGKFITSWGPEFKGGGHGIEIRKEGNEEFLYCCDVNRRVTEKRTLKGEIVWTKGVPIEAGVHSEHIPFIPTNIALSPDGGFYVADGYGYSYIHQYDKDARWVRCWGGNGHGPGDLFSPHGIIVDTRGPTPLVLIADRANSRLQYFTMDGRYVSIVPGDFPRPCHFDIWRDEILLIPDLNSQVSLYDRHNRLICHLSDGQNVRDLREKPRAELPVGRFVAPHGCRFLPNGDFFITEWVTCGRINLLRRVS